MFEYEQRFFGRTSNGEEGEFLAESESRFFDVSGSVVVEFIKDDSGAVTQLILYTNGERIPVPKVGR